MEAAATMELWRHCSRRNRKAAFHNIFWGVNLCQLQRLFKESGDKRAEQRARLIWDTSDESELAKPITQYLKVKNGDGLRKVDLSGHQDILMVFLEKTEKSTVLEMSAV
uniref:Arginine vasopressin-induced protein 1 n=1 Tax=Erpetoichthys calabaricus TaxID=27687 RepID=A0A8C4REG1_ERPCA